jgi:hypothetical protein
MPPPWVSGWFDPELKELFEDQPELYETAHLLRSSRPEGSADPHFRQRLRAALMNEAATRAEAPRLRRWLLPRPRYLAWGGAAAGVALVAATVVAVFSGRVQDHQTVVAYSTLSAQHAVSPSDVITVAFNQPMDQSAVVSGLRIRPATEVRTSWQGNNLVITPLHHLAGNTPYTVSIAQPALRTVRGAFADAPVEITFGTAATPPPGATTSNPPSLKPSTLGQAANGSSIVFAPDGSVVADAGLLSNATTPPSPAAASASPSVSPSAAQVNATPTPSGQGRAGPQTIAFPRGGGTPTALFQRATAVAFRADGSDVAAAVDDGAGGSDILIAAADGSRSQKVASTSAPVVAIAWSSAGNVIYATATSVSSVDTAGAAGPLVQLPAGAGPLKGLSANGRYAFLSGSATSAGHLFDVATGAARALSGSTDSVVFSGDSRVVAWVDQSASKPRLLSEPVDVDAPATISTLNPGSPLKVLSLSHDGSDVAYVLTAADHSGQLVVAQVPSGTPLAVGPAASAAVFSANDALAMLVPANGVQTVQLATVPGVTSHATSNLPALASSALNAFVDAQVSADSGAMRTLTASTIDAAGKTPRGLSRAHVIDAVLSDDGTVSATVTLIVDPTAAHAVVRVADEQITLRQTRNGGAFTVTALQVSPLHDQPAGPHIVHLSNAVNGGQYVVQVSFDSDLARSTVDSALTILNSDGTPLTATTTYDPDSRTATVTLERIPSGQIRVHIAPSLRDVNGDALASPFSATLGT